MDKFILPQKIKESKIQINKQGSDNKDYKYIVLPNQMRCLLISDPLAQKSAISLELQAGCLQDPY